MVKHGRLLQFADDTIYIDMSGENHDTVKKRLSSDLQRIQSWIASSRMRLNVKKSSIMWFTPKQASSVVLPPILVDGYQLQNVEKQKYLGILFDKNLQWGPQLSHVCKAVSYYNFTFAEPSL